MRPRAHWLRAVLLGLLIGPPGGADLAAERPLESEPRAKAKRIGHVVRGPNFYVWDEDPREAADWAAHLRVRRSPRTPHRA